VRVLERDGLVSRSSTLRCRGVEYGLTDLARSLITPIHAARAWAQQNAETSWLPRFAMTGPTSNGSWVLRGAVVSSRVGGGELVG
jgi:hypothetical protein